MLFLTLTLTLNTKKTPLRPYNGDRICGRSDTLALFARGQHKNTTRNPKLNPK